MEGRTALIVCVACGREIECCAFCDEQSCVVAACHRCVGQELRQRVTDLHRAGFPSID